MATHHHKNNVGTTFRATVTDQNGDIVRVGIGDVVRVLFSKPDGTTLTKTASIIDGDNGIFGYTTISGDIDEAGTWKVQGYIQNSDGHWYGDISKFKVLDNIA